MELYVLVYVYVCIVLEKLYEFKVCIFVNFFNCNLIIGEYIYIVKICMWNLLYKLNFMV